MKECYIRFLAQINNFSIEHLLKIIDAKITDGYTRIHLMINSPGGSVAHGLALYNILKSNPIEVYTYNIGSVDSIGVIVFCSGDRRFSVPNSRFLIHPVQLNAQGNYTFDEHKLNEHVKSITIDQQNIINIIAQTTNKEPKEIEKKIHNRTTFTAEEAKKQSLVDIITKMPFIPANAEVISVPESSSAPPNLPPQIQLPGGIRLGINDNFTSIFANGVGFTNMQSCVL